MSLGMSIYVIFIGKKAPRRPYLLLLSFGKKFPRVSYKDLEARLILAAPLDSGIDAALATCGVWRPILCGELGFQRFRVS